MLLDPKWAAIFMRDYVGLMAEIYVGNPEHEKRATVTEVVAKGRARYAADPKHLDAAIAAAAARAANRWSLKLPRLREKCS